MKAGIKICALILMIVFTGRHYASAKTNELYSMVRIDLGQDPEERLYDLLRLHMDITYSSAAENYMDAIVNADQISGIQKLGFHVTPYIADFAAYSEGILNEQYFEHFHNYNQMLTDLQQLAADHPDLAALYDIGDSFMKVSGQGGYDIWALKISDNVAIEDPDEADALFNANMHAREIITPEILLFFAHYLMDQYGKNAYITHLVNNREIWIVPMVNPDGHERVFSGNLQAARVWDSRDPILWRKNLRDNNLNGLFDRQSDGVDLNRNFGFLWGLDDAGSSGYEGDDTYRGTFAFSEPETQAIRTLVDQHSFVTSLSFHSYGKYWIYPWGYDYLDPPEPDFSSFRALADSCVAYNDYSAGNIKSKKVLNYVTNGDSDDWLYGEKHIFAFTPEVGTLGQGAFWPDTTFIQQQIMENLGPCIYMAYAAGEEPLISYEPLSDVENAQPGYPLYVKISQPVLLSEYVPLNTFSCKIFYTTGNAAPFQSVDLMPTRNADQYLGTIPGGQQGITIYYYVQAADLNGRTGARPRGAPAAVDSFKVGLDNAVPIITENAQEVPRKFSLTQNYPNPFNSHTKFEFEIPHRTVIRVAIYNTLGQLIKILANQTVQAGIHTCQWDGCDQVGNMVVSGIYLCQLESLSEKIVRKIIYVK